MSAASAAALHARQRRYDELHHRMRLEWLSCPKPRFADGEPVPAHDVLNWKAASHKCLRLIQEHGMSTNSVGIDDSEYLAELDLFATRGQ